MPLFSRLSRATDQASGSGGSTSGEERTMAEDGPWAPPFESHGYVFRGDEDLETAVFRDLETETSTPDRPHGAGTPSRD
jgi:hypothetical protein